MTPPTLHNMQVDTTVQRAEAEGNLPLKGYKDVSRRFVRDDFDGFAGNPPMQHIPTHSFHPLLALLLTQPAEFVKSLATPRKIVILVMAGKPVDATIELLAQHMEVGESNRCPTTSVQRMASIASSLTDATSLHTQSGSPATC